MISYIYIYRNRLRYLQESIAEVLQFSQSLAMSIECNLRFEISAENRKITADVIDEMLKFITEKRSRYEGLSKVAKDHCEKHFATTMAVNFVHQASKAKCDDRKTFDGTEQLLEKYKDQDDPTLSHSDKECINISRALRASFYGQPDDLESNWTELRRSGQLTVDVVRDLHKTLLKGFENGGKIREREGDRGDVKTSYGGKIHYYPIPEVVEMKFYGIIDEHNIHADHEDKDTAYIFKCAAWLFFELISLHPFYDGNGRVCRLLANYVVSLITPFPVSIYNTNSTDRNRENYIDAIVLGRKDREKGLGDLASMLVESAYIGWKDLFQYLEQGGLLRSKPTAGPIVVQKSHKDQTEDRVKRFCRIQNISHMEEDVLAKVQSVVESVSDMTQPDEHITKEIEYPDMFIEIRVYP